MGNLGNLTGNYTLECSSLCIWGDFIQYTVLGCLEKANKDPQTRSNIVVQKVTRIKMIPHKLQNEVNKIQNVQNTLPVSK